MVWEVLYSKVVPINYKRNAQAIQVDSLTVLWGASAKARMRVGSSAEVAPRDMPKYSQSKRTRAGKALKVGVIPSTLKPVKRYTSQGVIVISTPAMWNVWVVSHHLSAKAQWRIWAILESWVSTKYLKPATSTKEWVVELSLPHHLRTSVGLPRDRKVRKTYKRKRDMSQQEEKHKKVEESTKKVD